MKFDVISNNIKESQPLIYMWEIFDGDNKIVGRYIGKAKAGSKRPLKHYKRNISRLIAGKPYRKSNPNGYRQVHHALAAAVRNDFKIKLTLLCNIENGENINEIELVFIEKYSTRGSEYWQLNG